MNLSTIALSNLIRRKAKTAFLVAGLLIGITASVMLLSITQAMKTDFEGKLDKFGANMIIVPRKEELPLTYGSVSLPGLKFKETNEIDESNIAKIKKTAAGKKLTNISPKLAGSLKIQGKNILAIGLNFNVEKKIKGWWQIKGRYPSNDKGFILGESASKKLNLTVGDKLKIKDKSFTLTGILKETGSSEDYALITFLEPLQQIFNKENKITLIEASVVKNGSLESVARGINSSFKGLKASAIKESMKAKKDNLNMFTWFSLASSLIILLIASLIVFITMMSSVNERVREIGIFRALGFRKKHVIKIIMTEALVVSFTGGLAGSFLGYSAALLILPKITREITFVPFNPLIVIVAVFLAIVIGIVSSIAPARKAARLDPAEALRFI